MTNHPRRRAFTLIEVMLVLLIIGGLAALAVYTMGGRREKANRDLTDTRIKKVVSRLQEYSLHMNSQYPTEDEGGLKALVTKPQFDDEKKDKNWAGPYLAPEELKDFWDRDLKYELVDDASGRKVPHVWSLGQDGQDGTDDDVKSWTEQETGT